NQEKIGKSGSPRKSNLTDNESAKMKSSHGVIQGYDGVATVDGKHQVIVHAEAFGQPQEHDLLEPMIQGTRENFEAIGVQGDIFEQAKLTADAGFHTEQNMKMLFDQQIDAMSPTFCLESAIPGLGRRIGISPRKRTPGGTLHRRILFTIRSLRRASVLAATSYIATAATFRSGVLDL